MARIDAKTEEDVAGRIPGRITTAKGKAFACKEPEFGASSHMARMVLNVRKFDMEKRSAIDLKYNPKIIEICH